MSILARTIKEAEFKKNVVDYAMMRGWQTFHQLPAQMSTLKRWYSLSQGHTGYPDLTLARMGRVVILELKAHGRYATISQEKWLSALSGVEWHRDLVIVQNDSMTVGCVHPKDWDQIVEVLR